MMFVHSRVDDANLTPAEFRILGHIARRSDNKTGVAFPCIKTAAKACRMNKDTVVRAIRGLCEKGWLDRTNRKGLSSTYRIICPPLPAPDGLSENEGYPKTGVNPSNDAGLSEDRGGELSEDRGYEGSPSKVLHEGSPLSARESDFDRFWECYPRKDDFEDAKTAWLKDESIPPIEEILAALKVQKKSRQWKQEDGRFVPKPKKWIERKKWKDVPESARSVSAGGQDDWSGLPPGHNPTPVLGGYKDPAEWHDFIANVRPDLAGTEHRNATPADVEACRVWWDAQITEICAAARKGSGIPVTPIINRFDITKESFASFLADRYPAQAGSWRATTAPEFVITEYSRWMAVKPEEAQTKP